MMGPLRYSINVTLDGCCDHREMIADDDLFQNAIENINRRCAPLWQGDLRKDGGILAAVGLNGRNPSRGPRARDLGTAVQQLKRESGKGLFVGGVKLPLALAELGLIDE